jgi:hypothetical protein
MLYIRITQSSMAFRGGFHNPYNPILSKGAAPGSPKWKKLRVVVEISLLEGGVAKNRKGNSLKPGC